MGPPEGDEGQADPREPSGIDADEAAGERAGLHCRAGFATIVGMLLPRYGTRRLMALVAGAALYSLILSWGWRGSRWAASLSIGLAALAVAFLIQASVFAVIWFLAGGARRRPSRAEPVPSASPDAASH